MGESEGSWSSEHLAACEAPPRVGSNGIVASLYCLTRIDGRVWKGCHRFCGAVPREDRGAHPLVHHHVSLGHPPFLPLPDPPTATDEPPQQKAIAGTLHGRGSRLGFWLAGKRKARDLVHRWAAAHVAKELANVCRHGHRSALLRESAGTAFRTRSTPDPPPDPEQQQRRPSVSRRSRPQKVTQKWIYRRKLWSEVLLKEDLLNAGQRRSQALTGERPRDRQVVEPARDTPSLCAMFRLPLRWPIATVLSKRWRHALSREAPMSH